MLSHSHKRPQAQANYLSAEGYWGRRKGGSATKDLSGAGRKNVVGETACGLQRKIPRRGDEKGQSSRIPSRACVLSPCETL
jgi:hypothetical protein